MREIIINALVSIVSVVIGWYLSRYQLKPKEVPPVKNIKEAMKRMGRWLMKTVKKWWPLFVSSTIPMYFLISEFISEEPITRATLFKICLFLFIYTVVFSVYLLNTLATHCDQRIDRLAETTNMVAEVNKEIVGIIGAVSLAIMGPKESEPKKDSLTESQKQDAPSK